MSAEALVGPPSNADRPGWPLLCLPGPQQTRWGEGRLSGRQQGTKPGLRTFQALPYLASTQQIDAIYNFKSILVLRIR